MANTQAKAVSFLVELFEAIHDFTSDSFKAALYLASATMNKTATAYTATNEVTGTNYTAGGGAVTGWSSVGNDGTTAYVNPSANVVFTAVTLSTAFDAVLIYNASKSNKAVGVWTFGSQTVTAGDFTLTMPANDSTHALLQLT